jgi:Phosphodiester glycosidase
MPMARAACLTVLVAFGVWACPPADADLPLGPRSLDERRSSSTLAPGVRLTRIVRGTPRHGGPWRVQVLRVSPGVRVGAVMSNDVLPGRESVSAMARRAGALAAVNGGFFGSSGLFDGDPIGAFALDGRLISEPVGGRAALLVGAPPARPSVAGVRFGGSVGLGPSSRLLDGVDRARGQIPSCGGRGGDLPGQAPGTATVCTDSSELILYTPDFGARTRTARGGVEAVVQQGVVTRVREGANTRIPDDGYVLSGSGDGAQFLWAEALEGVAPALDLALEAPGRTIDPARYAAIVGGGPRLVKDGRLRVRSRAEGFEPAFVARNPRTLAGVRRGGALLLVTVDGRDPRRSIGVTLREAARVMRSLGARNAMNLDGGGSTTMVAGGRVVNRPSDGVERAVSDALVVLP